jgi:RNA polymerase primary sigma factor
VEITVNTIARPQSRARTADSRAGKDLESNLRQELLFDFVPHPDFELPEKENEILAPMPHAEEYDARQKAVRVPRDVPPELKASYEYPLLDREQEYHLFRKMNFLKFKAARLRDMYDTDGELGGLDEIEGLLNDAAVVREILINANMRLVVSIAKRYSARTDNFFELVSDGTMALVRAVEKFDCHRGFKLSTYASWAIMKGFARTIPDERQRRERFVTGHEELFDLAPDTRSDEHEVREIHERASHSINRLLEKLDSRDRDIIRMRAGLDNHPRSMTLEEIGQTYGISKERVRQLNARAMKKLRSLAEKEAFDL